MGGRNSTDRETWIHWDSERFCYREPYIARVGCPPWPAPSHRISLEPVFLRNLSSGFGIAGGVAIITPSDLDDMPCPVLSFLIQ